VGVTRNVENRSAKGKSSAAEILMEYGLAVPRETIVLVMAGYIPNQSSPPTTMVRHPIAEAQCHLVLSALNPLGVKS